VTLVTDSRGRTALPEDWALGPKRLNGRKLCVEWGCNADVLFVGLGGGRLGVVDARSAGVKINGVESLDRSRPLADVQFEDVEATAVGDVALVSRVRDALLVLYAADACGAGMKAYEMAAGYVKVRSQFGQVIGSFQAIKHQLANMGVELEPCRALYWYAAHAWDALPADSTRAAAIAKAHISDIAVSSARLVGSAARAAQRIALVARSAALWGSAPGPAAAGNVAHDT
jgi:alkylation response protein AidB-like acyl-CoA dehydrogenase